MSDPSGLSTGALPERIQVQGALEIKQPPPSPPKRKDLWDKLQALAPFLSGVIVAVVGYYLTGSVNDALKREQMNLSNVTEMRSLLLALQGPNAEEWQAAAFTLAAFGPPAVPPLVSALAVGDEVRTPHIEGALRSIGFSHPDAVCGPMIAVLDNHTGRFTWLTHKSAIRLIGDLECRGAVPVLQRYTEVVKRAQSGDPAVYAAIVDPSIALSTRTLDSIEDELTRAQRIVGTH